MRHRSGHRVPSRSRRMAVTRLVIQQARIDRAYLSSFPCKPTLRRRRPCTKPQCCLHPIFPSINRTLRTPTKSDASVNSSCPRLGMGDRKNGWVCHELNLYCILRFFAHNPLQSQTPDYQRETIPLSTRDVHLGDDGGYGLSHRAGDKPCTRMCRILPDAARADEGQFEFAGTVVQRPVRALVGGRKRRSTRNRTGRRQRGRERRKAHDGRWISSSRLLSGNICLIVLMGSKLPIDSPLIVSLFEICQQNQRKPNTSGSLSIETYPKSASGYSRNFRSLPVRANKTKY
ncbi:hypothetical protein B0H11DRAFT_2075139 [Mycena galericulata]|nr:hypothetical protein B0H11DRAFT_2075139 [Mycena galericulata]